MELKGRTSASREVGKQKGWGRGGEAERRKAPEPLREETDAWIRAEMRGPGVCAAREAGTEEERERECRVARAPGPGCRPSGSPASAPPASSPPLRMDSCCSASLPPVCLLPAMCPSVPGGALAPGSLKAQVFWVGLHSLSFNEACELIEQKNQISSL